MTCEGRRLLAPVDDVRGEPVHCPGCRESDARLVVLEAERERLRAFQHELEERVSAVQIALAGSQAEGQRLRMAILVFVKAPNWPPTHTQLKKLEEEARALLVGAAPRDPLEKWERAFLRVAVARAEGGLSCSGDEEYQALLAIITKLDAALGLAAASREE